MICASSIFTSWFRLVCGSQQSQLEFVLWWCGEEALNLQIYNNKNGTKSAKHEKSTLQRFFFFFFEVCA